MAKAKPNETDQPDVEEQAVDTSAVDDAQAAVVAAKAKVDEAQADHAAAVQAHADAVKATEVKPEKGKHILLDRGGALVLRDAPEGYKNDYRLSLDGANYEHVGDSPEGVWIYRSM